MAAANVLVKAGRIERQGVLLKKGLVTLTAIGSLRHIGHTDPVGGVAMWANNVQCVCRTGHEIPL
jgi:hypothetical protein